MSLEWGGDLVSTKEAVSPITDAAESSRAGYCCVTNVHQFIMTYDDPAFRRIVNGAELVISTVRYSAVVWVCATELKCGRRCVVDLKQHVPQASASLICQITVHTC